MRGERLGGGYVHVVGFVPGGADSGRGGVVGHEAVEGGAWGCQLLSQGSKDDLGSVFCEKKRSSVQSEGIEGNIPALFTSASTRPHLFSTSL